MAGNTRPVEAGVHRDLRGRMTYATYLQLDKLLDAQHPRSRPQHHDELLFIIQHQTSELWFKLVLHELRAARAQIAADALAPALKKLARVKFIQRTLTEQWSVLATLTPTEYAEFRGVLGNASGLQSAQYRAVEFLLGNKDAEVLELFAHDPDAHALLSGLLGEPSLWDQFLRYLSRRGHEVPAELLERDWTRPYRPCPALVPTLTRIYERAEDNWEVYEACEELVDLEENFQLWRFRHMKTVERTIGYKPGTGVSSGVEFLKAALEVSFFPELYALRTHIGRSASA
jgi:tryptophan 2,3-dioxygenase